MELEAVLCQPSHIHEEKVIGLSTIFVTSGGIVFPIFLHYKFYCIWQ